MGRCGLVASGSG